jgi:hypothetical protein
MREGIKTAIFAVAALALAVVAAVVEPESYTPSIMSDQGEPFFPNFTDAHAVKTIEVIDYDEATATARPFKVAFEKGRWILPSHNNYPVEIGDRLVRTSAALTDLRKDEVRSDSPHDHAKYGVIDPLDQKSPSLTGRGKRVTLRAANNEVLADFIFGKTVEGKTGLRYVRLPNEKRTYAVKTDADPSARFSDWVNAELLRIASSTIRKVTIHSYSIDEGMGTLGNMETVSLIQENGQWKSTSGEPIKSAAIQAMAATLDHLKIVDARPKPPSLAADLKKGQLQLSLETAMSLRQRGFFLSPNGRLLANEGEMAIDTANGLTYVLRFGEVAASGGDNRYLFVTVNHDAARAAKYGGDTAAGERLARELNTRFADWYYVIGGSDFKKLRLTKQDALR